MTQLRFRVAIPARYGSSRLPGKPLLPIAGQPMIQHVYRQALASGAKEVVIATDDTRIYEAAKGFGADACMTAADHASGTDRLAEVAQLRGWADDDIVVNVQGDEPLMPPLLIRQVALGLESHPDAGIATACTRIHSVREALDPHTVKAVMDAHGYALYFSRAPIPHHREAYQQGDRLPEDVHYFHHIGLYAYRAGVLRRYPTLPRSPLEQIEFLEQLRALWNGIRIYVQEVTETPSVMGVDTEQDLQRVEAYLAKANC